MGRMGHMGRLGLMMAVCGLWSPVSGHCRDYPVTVTRVVDGDTVDVVVDLGLGVSKAERVRIEGVYAAELHEVGGEAAKFYMENALRCPAGEALTLRTTFDARDKYGRLLGVFLCGETNINEQADRDLGRNGKGAK